MGLTRHLQGLAQRFDTQALNPPPTLPGPATSHHAVLAALQAWCLEGAGPGGVPWWQPGRPARVGQRLAVAVLHAAPAADTDRADGAADGTAPHCAATAEAAVTALANRLALTLDGSLRLAALGRAAGLAWRAQVKLADACWWRQRQPADPWDAGWARMAPASVRHLTKHFTPRRPTLVLADVADAAVLTLPLAHLRQRAGGLPHPVRWLWVGGAAATAALPAERRFSLG